MVEVVVGALISEGRVLLVHRRPERRVNPDVWDLPGGVMEAGESEPAGLARELHEELGVQVDTDSASHLCRVPVRVASTDEPTSLSAWLVLEWQGVPSNVAPEEHDGIGWFGIDDLPLPPHVLVRSALIEAMHSRRG